MKAALDPIGNGIAAATLRIADAAPALILFGPSAAIAALVAAWLAGLRWAPAG